MLSWGTIVAGAARIFAALSEWWRNLQLIRAGRNEEKLNGIAETSKRVQDGRDAARDADRRVRSDGVPDSAFRD